MLNLRKLIDMLPYYYKGADTYKNKEGKGIFERYLEIFGNYFEDQVVEDTSTLQDILDIDSCDELYLNHLWEFLGQMPFAQGPIIDVYKWKVYFDGLKFKEENAADYHGKLMKTFQDSFIFPNLNTDYGGKNSKVHGDDQDYAGKDSIFEEVKSWREACIVPTNSSENFNPDNEMVRALLKYSISLFKIRGTSTFFEVLFRIYGLNCEIGQPKTEIFNDDPDNVDYAGKNNDYAGIDSQAHGDSQDYAGIGQGMYISRYGNSKLDTENSKFDDYTLDRYTTCSKCVTIPVKITGHSYTNINGKGFESFRVACENIFDRFLPINVKAEINYGFTIPQTYTLSTYLWDGIQWVFLRDSNGNSNANNLRKLYLQDGIITDVKIKVKVSRTYNNRSDLKFVVGSTIGGKEVYGENEHNSEYVIHARKATSYIIRSLNANSNGNYAKVTLTVTRLSSIRYYNIGYLAETLNISAEHTSISITLSGTVSFNGNIFPVNIRRMDTGEVLQVDNSGNYTFVTKEAGTYTFSLVDYPIRQISITVTKDPEVLTVTVNPTSDKITNYKKTVSTLLNIQGSYHQDDVIAIQAVALSGLLTNKELEDLFVQTPDNSIPNNKVVSHTYAMASIPLYKIGSDGYNSKEIILQVRFCCIKNPIRNTTQWVNHRKYIQDKGEDQPINTFTNLLPNIKMHDGYINTDGEIVEDPNWQYSDWIDVQQYAEEGTSVMGVKDRLEFWLVCSPLTCYEINNKDILYNCGEFFNTNRSGYFIFEAQEKGNQATFLVSTELAPGVTYYLKPSTHNLTYPYNGTSVSLLITIGTNLDFAKGKQLDSSGVLNFGFIIDKFNEDSNEWEATHIQVPSDDSGWVIDNNNSKYTKRYSVQFNKEEVGSGTFRIRSLDEAYLPEVIILSDYVDPEKEYLYFEPINSLDAGWLEPSNWGTATVGTPSNSPANAKWDLLKGIPKFKIRVLNHNGYDLNDIELYSVQFTEDNPEGIETLVGNTYKLNDTVSDLIKEGTYRFKVKEDTNINFAQITLVKNTIFKITCTPVIAVLSNGFAVTTVVGSCNDPDVNDKKLQVKREGDTVWHDSPYQFVGHTTGIYNFKVRGEEKGTEPKASFQIIGSTDIQVSPSSLSWEAEDYSAQSIDLVTGSSTSWEATVEDS